MKKLIFLFIGFLTIYNSSFSQTNLFDLKSQKLHKKVAKTIEYCYSYHQKSGGFVKTAVTINNYNDLGLLTDKYYQYSSTYSGKTTTTETLYNYNSKNQLISTEDISAKKSAYSSNYIYKYNTKGNLIKKEAIYKNGNKYTYNYYYDSKNRLIRTEDFDARGKLSARENYSYNGNKKIKTRKSYNSETGNVSGTYTTYYKNSRSIRYTSKSKYSNNDVAYRYDKKKNLIGSINKEKPNSNSKYIYEYDKKGNWVKKHYKYGNSGNNFYFREIIFKNGNTSGTSEFDKSFVNRNGDFPNLNIVPITKYKSTKNTTTKKNVLATYSDPSMPIFTSKNYIFNYVNINKKVNSVSGEVNIRVKSNDRMSKNSTVEISYSFGGKTFRDNYTVIAYSNFRGKKYHFWSLKSNTKSSKISFTINYKKKFIKSRDMYLSGMLNISYNDKNTGFYLE